MAAISVSTLVSVVQWIDKAFDVVAPFAGLSEFTPLADALTALVSKVQSAASGQTPALDAEVAGAQAAAKAAALAAGLK